MTLVVALENSELTDVVKVGNEILTMDGSNIYQIYYYDIVIKDILNNLGINVNKKFLLQSDIRRIVGKTKKKVYEL